MSARRSDSDEDRRAAEPIRHPFGVSEGCSKNTNSSSNRTCSAFSVVRSQNNRTTSRVQLPTANSSISHHPRMRGSIPYDDRGTARRNVTISEPNKRTARSSVSKTEYNRATRQFERHAQQISSVCTLNAPDVDRGRVIIDPIGPGISFQRQPNSRTEPGVRTSDNSRINDYNLRRRGRRSNHTMTESEIGDEAPTSVDRHVENCGNCGKANAVNNGATAPNGSATNGAVEGNGSHRSNERSIRNRLSNNLELLSRPSWCNAKFAYDQVRQGKATGNKPALWFRAQVHRLLFRLGCFIQRRATLVLIPGLIILTACAVGLKNAAIETKVENLWVESGGQLQQELNYSSQSLGNNDGTSFQLLIQTGHNTASIESLKLHLRAALAATKVTVTMFDQTWEMSDLCYKEVPQLGEGLGVFESIIERLFPCFIMGPLDCFYEGAELLGPNPPFPPLTNVNGKSFPPLSWKNLDPSELLDAFSFISDVRDFNDIVRQAGVENGYQDRWCLDPHNPECPEGAPNKKTKELPDVPAIFKNGCIGYAENLMKWPNDLIVGGIQRDSNGNITSASGLQSLIQLMGPSNMYNFHKDSIKTININWSKDKAADVLFKWQTEYVKTIYGLAVNASAFSTEPDKLHAFAPSTTANLILEFSNFSVIRVASGYFLMLAYACFTMLRCKASKSQGAVGVIGVLLVALSVMAGLGICSVAGIKFNAATTQVIPFLMLGLGVDDMFLIAHQFGEIAVLSYVPFQERTGECVKRVGVSVLLTSIAILSGFLFSLIIPMPALQSFSAQAAVITCFNLFAVLFVFPSVLSIDLVRRKNNLMDILCCVKSSSANEVIVLAEDDTEHVTKPASYQRPARSVHFTTLPAAPYVAEMGPEATITMHHTIQAYSNESYVTFLGPAAETTFVPANGTATDLDPPEYSLSRPPPHSPPPRYTPSGDPNGTPDPRASPKIAFQDRGPTNSSSFGVVRGPSIASGAQNSSNSNRPTSNIVYTRSEDSYRGNQSNSSTAAPSTLATPMASVRSSTHSLVPTSRSKASRCYDWLCCKRSDPSSSCFPIMTVTEFATKYYGPFLMKTPVRITVLVSCTLLLGASIYGCLKVKDGLDLIDILPRDSKEHDALSAQMKYFSFYNMHLVTKDFDIASKQKELHMLHQEVNDLSYIVRNTDGTKAKFWLEYMRDWLKVQQSAFDHDWNIGLINQSTWTPPASKEGKMAFKLLLQTGKLEMPTDSGRIGCEPPLSSPCPKVNIVRLVSEDGIIREDGFYNYLTAWVQNDPLSYIASLANILPKPPKWNGQDEGNFEIPRANAIKYSQMPYFLNGLRENDDFVSVIRSVRGLCDKYYSEYGVRTYPSGYPFMFWQQYIDLRQWLFIAMGAAIVAISLVVAVMLLNLWAAGITFLFLLVITTELLGFMGAAAVKLSAVPAVILVAAIGLGVEFTVHITLAFITSCGSRCDRSKAAISHMMGPVIDGAMSTFLGVVMLSSAEFDFIVRYFFQVLSVLVLIGAWNGLVLLPVVLSYIGPPPEVIPVGGGNRLKTPTPPPTPPLESEDHAVGNRNWNNSNGSMRRCRRHQCCRARTCASHGGAPYDDRDDRICRHDARQCCPSHPRRFDGRYPSYVPRSMQHFEPCYPPNTPFPYQVNPSYCHTHSVGSSGTNTPSAVLDERSVTMYPHANFVLYTPDRRTMNNETIQHCDSPVHLSTSGRILQTTPHSTAIILSRQPEDKDSEEAGDKNATPNDRGQHIATLQSSVTVKFQQYPPYSISSRYGGSLSSSDTSPFDVKFQPINAAVVDRAVEKPSSTSVRNSNANNSESSRAVSSGTPPDSSKTLDAPSVAVDSAFKDLGNDDVTG